MSPATSRRRAQGVARFMLLIVIGLVAFAGVVILALLKSRAEVDDTSPTVIAAAGPVVREGAGTDELLQHARQAMAEQRLLAPAGNNAFELYLAVLKREPGNRVAQDALREIFPFASHAAEQTIDQGDATEAQRQIDLLGRADPQNYTVTLLQTKLQAQRDATAQQAQSQQLAQVKKLEQVQPGPVIRPAAPAAPVVTTPVPTPTTAAAAVPATKSASAPTAAELALAQLNVESTKVKAAPTSSMRPRAPAVTAVVDANGNATPVLTHRVDPTYPSDARRSRRQGWVDVTFTVQADGTVSGASVTDADPKYVFDRSALNAVTHWQFTPGMQDGKPVAAQLRQRIEFHL